MLSCAAAAALVAQSPTTSSPTQPAGSASASQAPRTVTAVGCLKQEKDIPGRLSGSAASTGGEAQRTPSGEAFVLVAARITGAPMPHTPTGAPSSSNPEASAPGVPTGSTPRQTLPSGTPGASGAGTSGTGSTSAQSSDRPPSEAAQNARAAAQPSVKPGDPSMYRIVGLPDQQLLEHLNQQVEVRATLDPSRMGGAAVRQPATTMGREPASTPSASTPPPAPMQPGEAQPDRASAPPPDDLPELRAMTIKATGGRCQGT